MPVWLHKPLHNTLDAPQLTNTLLDISSYLTIETGNFFSHQVNPIGIMEGHRIGEKMVTVEGKGKGA